MTLSSANPKHKALKAQCVRLRIISSENWNILHYISLLCHIIACNQPPVVILFCCFCLGGGGVIFTSSFFHGGWRVPAETYEFIECFSLQLNHKLCAWLLWCTLSTIEAVIENFSSISYSCRNNVVGVTFTAHYFVFIYHNVLSLKKQKNFWSGWRWYCC